MVKKVAAVGPRLVTPNNNLVMPDANPGIQKPGPFAKLDRFRVKQDPQTGAVGTLLTALPHYKISDANDFVRLHPDKENYWSPPWYFIAVPIKGQKRDILHLVTEDIAEGYLRGRRFIRMRLALASKPHDVFFLCHIPAENLDNSWNDSNLRACDLATEKWVWATSQKAMGVDKYKTEFADDKAFPLPKWTTQPLVDLIEVTFAGVMIDSEDHPSARRLRGVPQDLK
jgi:hypothetical protein